MSEKAAGIAVGTVVAIGVVAFVVGHMSAKTDLKVSDRQTDTVRAETSRRDTGSRSAYPRVEIHGRSHTAPNGKTLRCPEGYVVEVTWTSATHLDRDCIRQ